MIRRDLHTHTCFSDGRDTPEEMILAAIQKELDTIGISDHSYTFFDESYCLPKARIPEYRDTIAALKRKYAGSIRVLCGIEQDFYSAEPTVGYDYVIGSVHYLLVNGEYIPVDEKPETLRRAVQTHFGGDFYALCRLYFETAAQVVTRTNADIIGHLDLVRKFNRGGRLFDETNPRYRDAAYACVDELLKTGKPFEINTGAISRGYLDTPYPAPELIRYIQEKGGTTILSSDSHNTDTLCFGFDTWKVF